MSDLISGIGTASKLVMKIVLTFLMTYVVVSAIHFLPIKGLVLAVAVDAVVVWWLVLMVGEHMTPLLKRMGPYLWGCYIGAEFGVGGAGFVSILLTGELLLVAIAVVAYYVLASLPQLCDT
jgi:hypothetical protein